MTPFDRVVACAESGGSVGAWLTGIMQFRSRVFQPAQFLGEYRLGLPPRTGGGSYLTRYLSDGRRLFITLQAFQRSARGSAADAR
jgi:hypothetical protein